MHVPPKDRAAIVIYYDFPLLTYTGEGRLCSPMTFHTSQVLPIHEYMKQGTLKGITSHTYAPSNPLKLEL